MEELRNKKILITGASGLIGSGILNSLMKIYKEYNITVWTWSKTYDEKFNNRYPDFLKIFDDITKTESYLYIPTDFDYIIHSSGYGQPVKFLQDKLKTLDIATNATKMLFNHLKKDGTFLFLSSSEVYNGLNHYNIDESEIGNTNPTHPRASYIEGKRCGETICNIFREDGYNAKVARVSMVYGPGTKSNDLRALSILINKGLQNDCIELIDKGNSIRTFCYVDDAVNMLWNILLYGKDFIYNIGGKDTISILEAANIIGSILNKKVVIPDIQTSLPGNPNLVNLSIQRYIQEFGNIEFTSIYDGLKKTIEWEINNKYE